MRSISAILSLIAALTLAVPAWAQSGPPPDHPTIRDAERILDIPQKDLDQPFKGRVTETIDAGMYTYVRVDLEGQDTWLAVPKKDLPNGTMVRFGSGAVMKDFHSKKLDRTFETVVFLSDIRIIKE